MCFPISAYRDSIVPRSENVPSGILRITLSRKFLKINQSFSSIFILWYKFALHDWEGLQSSKGCCRDILNIVLTQVPTNDRRVQLIKWCYISSMVILTDY